MKKLTLLCLFFASFAIHKAHAQPTFYIDPPEQVVDPGDEVCVQVRFTDFTNLIEISFSIEYDSDVIANPQVTPVSMAPGMTTDNVDFPTPGIITFDWNDGQPCQTAVNGPTFVDHNMLFEVCFDAVGDYGEHTFLCFADEPVDQIVHRSSANCQDIGEFTECGYISLGTESLKVNISSADGFQGDVVCLDFEFENFDCIVSFQNSVLWDEEVLQFLSATPSNLQEFTAANIGTTQVDQGVLNLSWWTTGTGIDLPDGTQFLEVCFEIIGECGDNSSVSVGPNPAGAPIEVVDCTSGSTSAGTNIGMLQTEGEVSVNCFDPDAITVTVEDKQICPGETFTVDVTVEDFDDITDLEFTLKWNPSVISLNNSPDVSFPDGTPCFLFGTGGTMDVNPTQGTIVVDWNSTGFGCNVDDNDRLMRLHFTAVGSSGTNTTVSIINPINVEQFGGGDNIGINNNNGLIEICELNSPTIIASSATLDAGEQVCVEFTVQDFEDILRTQYTLNWEPSILEYVGPQAFNLPGLGSFNFLNTQTNQGFLGVEWENGTPVTMPDGAVIFEICFNVIGDPDECSPVEFAGVPWPVDVVTEESGGTNVGLNGVSGQVCVENPLDLFMDISEAYGSPGAEVCLDVTAEGFTQITQMDYSINWNTSILEFARIEETGNLPNFTDASYDDSPGLVDDGQLVVNWLSNNTLQGTTLADGTVLYRICFTVIGDEDGECAGVSISGIPESIDVKTAPTGSANLGMDYAPGEICVNATISLLSPIVVDVACPTVPSGSIDLTVEGGSGEYIFEWAGFNVNPSSEDQNGLYAGTYFVTVTDANNPALNDEMEITVALEPNAPIAEAGVDTSLNCLSQGLTLDGTGSSVGSNLIYVWEAVGPTGSVNPETDSTMNAEIFGPGAYVLTVTDENTGCQDIDTVQVAQAIIAVPEIEQVTDMLTCEVDTVFLNGGQSAFGFDVLWETSDGSIVPGTENDLIPMVTEPGMYILTFSNPETSCARSDTVMVAQDIAEPDAEAGDLATLGCQDDEVTIDGTGSSTGAEYIYEWTPTGMGEICGDENALITTACSAGEYQLLVTNTDNGCTAIDVVMVEADTSKPIADAGPNLVLDCVVDMVTLDGSGSSQGAQYEYVWFDESNTQVGTGLTFDATTEGVYTLEVMNTDNDCSAISEVVVDDIADTFAIFGEASNAITCGVGTSLLVWGNTPVEPEYTHTWIDPSGTPIGNTDSLTVSEPGMYTFEVLNTENQCTESLQVEVIDQTDAPEISAGNDMSLGCVDFIILSGDNMGNANLIYQWSGPGVGCITNGTTLTPEVECPGEYTLNVVDTVTQCSNSAMVTVIDDAQEPTVAIENLNANNEFPCNQTELTLNGSTDAVDADVMWTSVPNVPITGQTTLTPTISEPAIYTLTITAANGCTSDSTIAIAQAMPPTADAGMDGEVDCLDTEYTISAANSTLDGTTVTWVALVGNDPANPNDVDVTVGAGTYQLTVIDDETGCSSMDEVEVVNNAILPDVEAGNDIVKECDEEFAILLGDADTDLTISWLDEDGNILGGNLQFQATNEGTYYLSVFDASTNCVNQDSATVTFSISADPAEAMADHGPCEAEAMLMGNLPEGATGEWQALTGGTVDNPNAETALASGFSQGENQFLWVLSLGTCVEYSADTVTIVVDESVPVAENDFITLDAQSGGAVELNVLENDVYDPAVTTFALLDSQNFIGSAELADDGTLSFSKEKCFSGLVEVEYELCNSTCPDLCDQATVSIDVLLDETENCEEVPNAITPNGDGVNDELVFDILLSNPDFKDNEIVIFNRWGDVVYEAKPYMNDWRGTNDSGKELPHGTYYYILKLDIANGDIIRGDVTILK